MTASDAIAHPMSAARTRSPRGPAPIRARNLPLLLLQARESVLARFRPLLNANGVTEQQWRIVRALAETGPLEPRQIVQLCGISSPSLAGVLARMEALGFVERERLEHDQRRQRVSLTATSRALVTRMAPQVEATYAVLEKELGRERLATLHAVLDDVLRQLGPADESAAAD
jgi:homoprotocatechuate degradation regulator HpaR